MARSVFAYGLYNDPDGNFFEDKGFYGNHHFDGDDDDEVEDEVEAQQRYEECWTRGSCVGHLWNKYLENNNYFDRPTIRDLVDFSVFREWRKWERKKMEWERKVSNEFWKEEFREYQESLQREREMTLLR